MEFTLSLSVIAGLFISLAILAAMPSLSVLIVSTRAALYGLRHGIAVALGIVLADIVFICIALYGLKRILQWAGEWQWLIQVIAAGYLFWLAVVLWRSSELNNDEGFTRQPSSIRSSFLIGFFATIVDHKAILFYMAFFPVWMDLTLLTTADTVLIILLTVFSVVGVKSIYAVIAAKAGQMNRHSEKQLILNKLAAILLCIVSAIILLSLLTK